jgi:hypothetical protein
LETAERQFGKYVAGQASAANSARGIKGSVAAVEDLTEGDEPHRRLGTSSQDHGHYSISPIGAFESYHDTVVERRLRSLASELYNNAQELGFSTCTQAGNYNICNT